MFKVILKNGTEIKILAKRCVVQAHKLTGECIGYSFEEIEKKYCNPLYINPMEIAAILDLGDG